MEPNETMVENEALDTEVDDTLPEEVVEEEQDESEDLEAFTGGEEQPAEEKPAEESTPSSEPGWIKKRVEKAVTKAIAEGRYPSPPARDLYLVTKGVPTDPVVVAFLKYVLTDGQKKNEPVGYIEIAPEKIDKSLTTLGLKK